MAAMGPAVAVALLASLWALCAAYPPYAGPDSAGDRPGAPPHQGPQRNDPRGAGQSYEPFVVLASGRRLPYSAHRRLVSLERRKSPISVQLPSGQTVQFADCDDFLRRAPTSHIEGGQFVIPSESWPVEIALEAMETERAQHVRVELPSGRSVPYHEYVRSAPEAGYAYPTPSSTYPSQPRVADLPTDVSAVNPPCPYNDLPDENLFIMLGGGQRLLYKVHEAIHCHYSRKMPFDVRLTTGEREKIPTYEELVKKLLEPRFMDCTVKLAHDVNVPIETYRAVVEAHRHGNVYVEFPDGLQVVYSEFAKMRDSEKKDSFFKDLTRQERHEDGCCSEDTKYGSRGSGRSRAGLGGLGGLMRRRTAKSE